MAVVDAFLHVVSKLTYFSTVGEDPAEPLGRGVCSAPVPTGLNGELGRVDRYSLYPAGADGVTGFIADPHANVLSWASVESCRWVAGWTTLCDGTRCFRCLLLWSGITGYHDLLLPRFRLD